LRSLGIIMFQFITLNSGTLPLGWIHPSDPLG